MIKLRFSQFKQFGQFQARAQIAVSKGFTMVELMVVVALVAVVSAIAIPNFRDLIGRNNISSQVNEFIATLHLARTTAIQRGKYVTICRTTDDTLPTPVCSGLNSTSVDGVVRARHNWATGWIIFVEDDPSGALYVFDTNDTLVKRYPGQSDNYSIANSVTTSAQHITFNPQGGFAGASSAGIRFGFKSFSASNDTERTVCVSRGGSIRTVNANGTNACTDF
jgi:type IV fimbrial biogenesis protein FimT